MGQKVMGPTVPAGAACGDALINVSSDESVLILINHCRDMKRQEARLRLITLLLLLGCTALFVYSTCANLGQHGKSGSSRDGSAEDQTPAYSKQERGCPEVPHAETVQRQAETQKIHLQSTGKANGSYITWAPILGKMNYNKEKNAIVIPTTGIYFIYLRFTLSCNDDVKGSEFQKFHIQLHRWSEAYGKVTTELDAWESVKCQTKDYQTLFVGQLFDRLDGEFLSVKVIDGYNLIKTSFFGAFLQ
ncbi:uncharacterized protein LOC113027389 [Astatotilapia calliptera]|uniref:uncharacterized protein LOC113027389 n=1 Tax=Astatotilapia calliptera TaxID=8154 RepID=UPI000E42CBA4|nr:uncharacterized protein LOC113027389 [Astatotilapia calliptera]